MTSRVDDYSGTNAASSSSKSVMAYKTSSPFVLPQPDPLLARNKKRKALSASPYTISSNSLAAPNINKGTRPLLPSSPRPIRAYRHSASGTSPRGARQNHLFTGKFLWYVTRITQFTSLINRSNFPSSNSTTRPCCHSRRHRQL
jgi:hypothetical protein